MIYRIADNVFTPAGNDSLTLYRDLLEGVAATALHKSCGGVSDYFASVFAEGQIPMTDGMSRFESLMTASISAANDSLRLDLASDRVIFVISTTKGNISMLRREDGFTRDTSLLLYESALSVTRHFGNPNPPVVISNACISGLSAQIQAHRLITRGECDYAVVCGADLICDFIISGFQSFKALSSTRAKSFDASRNGLNLGEAAATIIYASAKAAAVHCAQAAINGKYVCYCAGAITNDANHISGPSRTAEGLFRALDALSESISEHHPGLVCCHGTATVYNDEMEAIALSRAGLDKLPINALKERLGHTLGAAGVLEVVLSMYQMCYGRIIPVTEYSECGVSVPLDVVCSERDFEGDSFIKTISGFGGCNAAALFCIQDRIVPREDVASYTTVSGQVLSNVRILNGQVYVNSRKQMSFAQNTSLSGNIFRETGINYPKFFKMDFLSRLGFVAVELLCSSAKTLHPKIDSWERTAVILANRHSSLDDDVRYLATISPDDYFPSPSLFVYTLPNIVAGEVAIRHKMYSETTFYISDTMENTDLRPEAEDLISRGVCDKVIFGWVDWYDNEAQADVSLLAVKDRY